MFSLRPLVFFLATEANGFMWMNGTDPFKPALGTEEIGAEDSD